MVPATGRSATLLPLLVGLAPLFVFPRPPPPNENPVSFPNAGCRARLRALLPGARPGRRGAERLRRHVKPGRAGRLSLLPRRQPESPALRGRGRAAPELRLGLDRALPRALRAGLLRPIRGR